MRVRMRGVNSIRKRLADGSIRLYYYHRKTGQRLAGEPGTTEFLKSYSAAEENRIAHSRDTLGALIDKFQESAEWRRLAESSQREYRRIFAIIGARYGTAPLQALEDRAFRVDVLDWRDKHAVKAPREADYRVTALARVLAWAADRGILHTNVLGEVRRAYRADRSDMIWLPEHIERFREVASIELQQALMLALHTGQRQGDLVRLTWSAYDGRAISLRQGKGKVRVRVPCTRALKAMLDEMQESKRAAVILTTTQGRPWKGKNLQHRWKAAMVRAGIDGLHFHDLRGTAVTMLSEAGCTPQEIASITGHSLRYVSQILDRYLARTRELAENAICKLDCKLTQGARS